MQGSEYRYAAAEACDILLYPNETWAVLDTQRGEYPSEQEFAWCEYEADAQRIVDALNLMDQSERRAQLLTGGDPA